MAQTNANNKIIADADYFSSSVQPSALLQRGFQVVYAKQKTITTANWDSRDDYPNDIDVSGYSQLLCLFASETFTGGTAPTVTLGIESVFPALGTFPGSAYGMYATSALGTLQNIYQSIGPGLQVGVSIGQAVRLYAVVAGTPTNTTFVIMVFAKV